MFETIVNCINSVSRFKIFFPFKAPICHRLVRPNSASVNFERVVSSHCVVIWLSFTERGLIFTVNVFIFFLLRNTGRRKNSYSGLRGAEFNVTVMSLFQSRMINL